MIMKSTQSSCQAMSTQNSFKSDKDSDRHRKQASNENSVNDS